MNISKKPWYLSLFKGEGRILIIPTIDHKYGYSIDADWFRNVNDLNDYKGIGEGILEGIEYIKVTPVSTLTPKERDEVAAWKKNSKYKSWISFWRNNNHAFFCDKGKEGYVIRSTERIEKPRGGYNGCIKEIQLPLDASAEEIGKAVIDVFDVAEEYFAKLEKK